MEVEGLTGAAHGERNPERITQRNNYRDRRWEMRAGTVELRIPKLRKAATSRPSWSRAGWPRRPWRRWCRKPACTACRPVLVDDLVKAVGMTGISKSQVSRLREEIDEKVKAFLSHPIEGAPGKAAPADRHGQDR